MLLVNGYRKTTAPGEREERHQRDLSYNNSSRDEQVDTRLATYPRNLIIDTLSLPLPLLAPWCAQRLATLSYTFARSFSFNHLQAKSTCLKKRCKHRNSGRIPSLIGSLTPAHGRLSRNMINNFCKRIISHPVKSQYLKYATRYIFTNMTSSQSSPKKKKNEIQTRPSRPCVTHQISCKKRSYSIGWTVPHKMMN